jgi:hypothetical protein
MAVKAQFFLRGTEKRDYRNTRHTSADAPASILRPSPVTGHNAEMLDVSNP